MNGSSYILFAALWLAMTLGISSGRAASGKISAADALFNGPVVPIKIQIKGKDLEDLKKDGRKYVHATLIEGTNVFTNIAVHLKGAAGSFRPIDQNPGLTVHMNKFVEGQSFHGLTKFNLNNSVQDPTFMTDLICSELFRKAGVPASRLAYARLQLNGRDLGLYLIVEGFNKEFFRQNFGDHTGNFYDSGFLKDVTEELEKTSGPNPKDQADLKALAAAANERDVTNRKTKLEKLLDLDRFISFLAMEIICWDWDGYPLKKNNYRLYHDPSTDKITFIPHGMDQMFWEVNAPITPGMEGLVARSVLEVPEFKDRYYARMGELITNVFDSVALSNKVNALSQKIIPEIREFNKDQARNAQNAANELRGKFALRAASVRQQLASRPRPVKFEKNGELQLEGWAPRVESGQPELKTVSGGDGYAMKCGSGNTICSWRLRLKLPPGRYEFQALAIATSLKASPDDKSDGFGIRISGQNKQKGSAFAENGERKKLRYTFGVSDQEVELICEMRASRGEVVFDKSGLRLIRK